MLLTLTAEFATKVLHWLIAGFRYSTPAVQIRLLEFCCCVAARLLSVVNLLYKNSDRCLTNFAGRNYLTISKRCRVTLDTAQTTQLSDPLPK